MVYFAEVLYLLPEREMGSISVLASRDGKNAHQYVLYREVRNNIGQCLEKNIAGTLYK